jgi:hypothetical protein
MGNLSAFMADKMADVVLALRQPEVGIKKPKGNYIALALVVAGTLPNFGESYSYGTVPTSVKLSGSNIVAVLKDLAYRDQCHFFGDGTVNGKKAKPKEKMDSQTFGTRVQAKTTGEVVETIDFAVDNFFHNIEFYNSMRSGLLGPKDIYIFTDKSVQVMRYNTEEPTFFNIGDEFAGSSEQDIPGGFSITWSSDNGQLVPYFGVRDRDLKFETLKYNFSAPAPLTGLTLIAGTANRYSMTVGTAGKIKRAVVESGAVRYSVYSGSNAEMPTAEDVAIDTDTGELSLASDLPIGRHTYTVAAENTVGVFGTYTIEVVVKAA